MKKGSSLAVPQAAGKYAPTDAKSDDNTSKSGGLSDDDTSNNGSKVGRSSEGSSDGGDGGMSDNAGSDTGSGIVTRSRRPSISVSSDGEEVERDVSVEEVVVSQIGSALCETGFIFGTRQECEIESTALTRDHVSARRRRGCNRLLSGQICGICRRCSARTAAPRR